MRVIIIATLVVALAGMSGFYSSDTPSASPITPQAFPGTNGRLVYAQGCDFPFELVTVDPDGANPMTIPVGNLSPMSVAASADGARIAFGASDGNVYVVNTDGSGLTPETMGTEPAWSPDGTKLAVVRQSGPVMADVWVVSVDGSTPDVNVSNAVRESRSPAWSPDGNRIAYVGHAGFDEFDDAIDDIFLVDPTGSSKLNMTNSVRQESGPSWAPDGMRIAAQLDVYDVPPDVRGLVSIDLSGTVSPLVNSESAALPQWSPDGSSVAYRDQGGIWTSVVGSGVGQNVVPVTCLHDLDWLPVPLPAQVEFTQATQQLQSAPGLRSDLQGDGKPPVPIVANKAAVFRVYFNEVDTATDYLVELSGEITDSDNVNVQPGCTAIERRRNESGCDSLDYYFTPPQGNWHVNLKVTDTFSGDVLLDERFDVTSVDTSGLIVKYLPVCVRMTPGAVPTCPGAAIGTAGDLMQKLFPVADDEFFYDALATPSLNYNAPITNDDRVIADLRTRYNLMSQGGFVADQLAGWLAAGTITTGTLGYSDPVWAGSTGYVSWQVDTTATDALDPQFTLLHEVGHNLGLRHVNLPDGCSAQDSTTDWPYADSTIQEVGFDVAAQQVVLPGKKDVMSYCSPPGTNIWISPFSYTKLVEGDFNPQALRLPSGAAMQYLVVKGTAQADGSAGTLDSAYVITSNTPADPSNPMGNYCLHTSGGAEIDHCFILRFQDHRTGEPKESETFSLRIPLPPGTARVGLLKDFQELAALEASAAAPSLEITEPQDGAEWSGEQTITWTASDGDGDPLQYAVMYSPDGGQTWLPLDVDMTGSELSFDSGDLKGDDLLVRVLASDGLNTTIKTVGPITLIGAPSGDVDCNGAVTSVDALKVLQNSAGLPVQQTQPCPQIGSGDPPFGDVNCDGAVGAGDALAVLRHVAGLPVNLPGGCPQIGARKRNRSPADGPPGERSTVPSGAHERGVKKE